MSVQQGAIDAQSLSKDAAGDWSLQSLDELIRVREDCFEAEFCSYRLVSRFQRIFSSTLQRGVGFEAFCLGINSEGAVVTPSVLFSKVCQSDDVELVDRLRLLLHLKNFKASGLEDRWIFTNLHPRIMLGRKEPDPTFLEAALQHTGLSPNQVVVALREHAPGCHVNLAKVIGVLRELGCLIVFDDFLSESANLNSLWKFQPDIVKLNRTWLENATRSSRAKRMLSRLISLVHGAGSLVITEQIETEEEAFLAMRVEADFVQGRFWGTFDTKPTRRQDSRSSDSVDQSFAALSKRSEDAVFQDARRHNLEMGRFTGEFLECAWALADDVPMKRAARALLHMSRVERVYLLNEQGVQSSPDLLRQGEPPLRQDLRYRPLKDSTGATWTRRSCFQDAICNPGVVQMSRPYRSNASRNICTTLSVTVAIRGARCVFCCDVEWREEVIL